MVAVRQAKVVVTLINDPNAPIFKNCDYGIGGDQAEVIVRLTQKLSGMKLGYKLSI